MVLLTIEDRIHNHLILDSSQVLRLSLPKWTSDRHGCSKMAQTLREQLESMTESVSKFISTQLILMMSVLGKQRLEDVQLSEIFLKFICISLLWKIHTQTL